jgi:hypothetical protein
MSTRPAVIVETVRPLWELFDALEQAGFDAERRTPVEQRSGGAVALALAIYLLEKLTEPEVDLLVATVRAWATAWFRPCPNSPERADVTIPIYGPRGEVLRWVEVDED